VEQSKKINFFISIPRNLIVPRGTIKIPNQEGTMGEKEIAKINVPRGTLIKQAKHYI
jgi:hypothetical protein